MFRLPGEPTPNISVPTHPDLSMGSLRCALRLVCVVRVQADVFIAGRRAKTQIGRLTARHGRGEGGIQINSHSFFYYTNASMGSLYCFLFLRADHVWVLSRLFFIVYSLYQETSPRTTPLDTSSSLSILTSFGQEEEETDTATYRPPRPVSCRTGDNY